MDEASASQLETNTETQLTSHEAMAAHTQFIVQWSQKIHVKREPTIFDVLRDELVRRQGLRFYGIEMKARPKLTGRLSSVLSSTAKGQALVPYQPKLLSNERAA